MAQQDLVHPEFQRGLEFEMEYIAVREVHVAKQFEGFNMRSLYSKTCVDREVKWCHLPKQYVFHSLQCADCSECVAPGQKGSKDVLKTSRGLSRRKLRR